MVGSGGAGRGGDKRQAQTPVTVTSGRKTERAGHAWNQAPNRHHSAVPDVALTLLAAGCHRGVYKAALSASNGRLNAHWSRSQSTAVRLPTHRWNAILAAEAIICCTSNIAGGPVSDEMVAGPIFIQLTGKMNIGRRARRNASGSVVEAVQPAQRTSSSDVRDQLGKNPAKSETIGAVYKDHHADPVGRPTPFPIGDLGRPIAESRVCH
jgi:hypothetical protein